MNRLHPTASQPNHLIRWTISRCTILPHVSKQPQRCIYNNTPPVSKKVKRVNERPVHCVLEGSRQHGFQRRANSPEARHKLAIALDLWSSSLLQTQNLPTVDSQQLIKVIIAFVFKKIKDILYIPFLKKQKIGVRKKKLQDGNRTLTIKVKVCW